MERSQSILSWRAGAVFLAPAAAFILVFLILPFFAVITLSFTNSTLTTGIGSGATYVGLQNYARLFEVERWMASGEFGNALRVSVIFVAGSALVGQAGLGLALAAAFHRRRGRLRDVITTLVILAWIIPDVVVAFMWIAFLDRDFGTLNQILGWLGAAGLDWLIRYPLLSIILFNTWRGTAFSMLLFSSALATIPPSYHETAAVAGATPWQAFRDVSLPLIRTHIVTDIILITLWTFNTFTPFLITAGGPAFRSELVSIFTYRVAFQFFEFGRGAAVAVVMMLVNLALALVYLRTLRRQAVVTG